jgi:branched-chain amino acid aminotransferase
MFVDGALVSSEDARVSARAHALAYGTGTFDGIRATWNERQQELYLLEPHAHFQRLKHSANALGLTLAYEPDELVEATRALLRANDAQEDVYVRPILFLAGELLTVRMHDIETRLIVYVTPFPAGYVPIAGVTSIVSSWRRIPDSAMPLRAKITGSYVNPALAKSEAAQAGVDEALLLTAEGKVCEASTANIFLHRDGVWITPSVNQDILEGITRSQAICLLEQQFGEKVVERAVDRSELYLADEAFLCGTAVQLAPLIEVDRRPVGDGKPGAQTLELMNVFAAIMRRESDLYPNWTTPVYSQP